MSSEYQDFESWRYNVTGNIINSIRGFAMMEGQSRPAAGSEDVLLIGQGRTRKGSCAARTLPRTTKNGAIDKKKPVMKFDDHFNGGFQFLEHMGPRSKEQY